MKIEQGVSAPRAPMGTGLGGVLAVVSAVAFGGSGVAAKPLIQAGLDPLHVAWLRVALSALVMLPLAVRHRGLLRERGRARELAAYGLFAVAGMQAFYFAAVARVPVGVALLIEFLGPALLLGWLRFVKRRPVARAAVLGAALAIVGLMCVVKVWEGLAFDAIGVALALAAAGCLAASFVMSAGAVDRDREPLPAGALLSYGFLVGAIALTAVARPWEAEWSVLGGPVPVQGTQLPAAVLVGWIVGVSTVLAYVTKVAAARTLSAQVAAVVSYAEAVVGAGLAWAVLGEAMTAPQIAGGVLVLVGAFVAQTAAGRTAGGTSTARVAAGGPRRGASREAVRLDRLDTRS